jgi:hypothetical protein
MEHKYNTEQLKGALEQTMLERKILGKIRNEIKYMNEDKT